jgi:uncharacterized integral membrane protein
MAVASRQNRKFKRKRGRTVKLTSASFRRNMQWKLIAAGLIVVVVIVFVVFVAGSVGDSGGTSLSNSTGSVSPEKENTQEETAEAVAPDSVAGVDIALYSSWMWIISLVIIIFLIAIIAVLLVRWRRPPDDEYLP